MEILSKVRQGKKYPLKYKQPFNKNERFGFLILLYYVHLHYDLYIHYMLSIYGKKIYDILIFMKLIVYDVSSFMMTHLGL